MRPLGRKSYGSIGHLPSSRLGEGDHAVNAGQARICTDKGVVGKFDRVYVQHKWDGSNCAIARVGDIIYPLTRSGWVASMSPYEQHRLFHNWVMERSDLFMAIIPPQARIVGEWLAQVHGTRYDIPSAWDAFVAFDIMCEDVRMRYEDFKTTIGGELKTPVTYEGPMSPQDALALIQMEGDWIDPPEGVIYRVENRSQVVFLAKYVRHDKVDGKYLFNDPPLWNWRPAKKAA